MGFQFPAQRAFKVEEGAGSPGAARPGEGVEFLAAPGSRRPAGALASVSCCCLVSGSRDRGSGLQPALCPRSSNSNNNEHLLSTCCGPGVVLRFYTYHLVHLKSIKWGDSWKYLHFPHFTKAQRV